MDHRATVIAPLPVHVGPGSALQSVRAGCRVQPFRLWARAPLFLFRLLADVGVHPAGAFAPKRVYPAAAPCATRAEKGAFSLIALTLLLWPALQTFAASVPELRERVEQGYLASDLQAMDKARVELLRLTADPVAGEQASYYAAWARFRQEQLVGKDDRRGRDYLQDCIDELEALVDRSAGFARAHALLGSCLGASSRYYKLRAATRGMAARRHLSRAEALAPDDPWVIFQRGVGDYATPEKFGGDRKAALAKLTKAAALFEQNRSAEARSGAAEAWLFIGRLHRDAGRMAEAREALTKAQSLSPSHPAIRAELKGL